MSGHFQCITMFRHTTQGQKLTDTKIDHIESGWSNTTFAYFSQKLHLALVVFAPKHIRKISGKGRKVELWIKPGILK